LCAQQIGIAREGEGYQGRTHDALETSNESHTPSFTAINTSKFKPVRVPGSRTIDIGRPHIRAAGRRHDQRLRRIGIAARGARTASTEVRDRDVEALEGKTGRATVGIRETPRRRTAAGLERPGEMSLAIEATDALVIGARAGSARAVDPTGTSMTVPSARAYSCDVNGFMLEPSETLPPPS
jgi:hypothetical protein